MNPSGLCMCGCGQKTALSQETRRGYKRGEPVMFRRGHHHRAFGPDYTVDQAGCWLWLKSFDSNGYGRIWVSADRCHEMAHRVYYQRFVGSIRDGYELHHRCGERACVNPEHLVEVTRARHMAIEGRRPFGNPKAPVPDDGGDTPL
jgi:hypothetical protein